MLKKTISYVDFNGISTSEDFYFHLDEADLVEMELSEKGGYGAYIKRIADTESRTEMIKIFKDLIMKSIGRKSPDGRRFERNEDIRKEFSETGAYSALFMELATQEDKAADFVNGLMPAELVDRLSATTETVELPQPEAVADNPNLSPVVEAEEEEPIWIRENRDPTPVEQRTMTQAQLIEAFRRKASQ